MSTRADLMKSRTKILRMGSPSINFNHKPKKTNKQKMNFINMIRKRTGRLYKSFVMEPKKAMKKYPFLQIKGN